jgi:hypothetical protein
MPTMEGRSHIVAEDVQEDCAITASRTIRPPLRDQIILSGLRHQHKTTDLAVRCLSTPNLLIILGQQ